MVFLPGLLGQVDEQLGGVRGTERGENISTSQGSTTHQDPNDEKPRKRRKILCLGIGKISESNEAKMQYLLLRDMITVLDASPLFLVLSTAEEKADYGVPYIDRSGRCGAI